MPPFGHRKPKPILKITDMVAPTVDVVMARKATWDAWIDECVGIQEAFIEGLLVQMAALNGRPG